MGCIIVVPLRVLPLTSSQHFFPALFPGVFNFLTGKKVLPRIYFPRSISSLPALPPLHWPPSRAPALQRDRQRDAARGVEYRPRDARWAAYPLGGWRLLHTASHEAFYSWLDKLINSDWHDERIACFQAWFEISQCNSTLIVLAPSELHAKLL